MSEMNKSSALNMVKLSASTVSTVQDELNDVIEERNSAISEAVNSGVSTEDIAQHIGVTVAEVEEMLAADRERIKAWNNSR